MYYEFKAAGLAKGLLLAFLAAFQATQVSTAQTQTGEVDHVIIVSVDGLRSDLIQQGSPEAYPGFARLLGEGASTLNARIDPDFSSTLPNHTAMVTGRYVLGSGGHGWTGNVDPPPGATLHGSGYVASAFDVVHDRGGRTGLFASKTKFSLLDTSYNAANGALDVTGTDQGRDKIDVYSFAPNGSQILDAFVSQSEAAPFQLAMLHIAEPDIAGHALGWTEDDVSAYAYAVRLVDHLIADLLNYLETDSRYAGRTAVILTSDHGGTDFGHSAHTAAINFTIPFLVWGGSVEAGGDLYAMSPARIDPGTSHLTRAQDQAAPAIRNGDAANLAMGLLGLPPVVGSALNALQTLRVRPGAPVPQPPTASFSIVQNGSTVELDGNASIDPEGGALSYAWDLGDGTVATGPTVSQTYSGSGSFLVTLTVTDEQGLTGESSEYVTVGVATATVSFRNGAAPTAGYSGSRDTKLLSDRPGQNFGSDPVLEADGFPAYAVLMGWDLESLPAGAGVQSASVEFTVNDVSGDTYGLFAVNRPWVGSEATWNVASSGQSWSIGGAAGADRGDDPLATFVPSRLGRTTVDLNALGLETVQRWVVDPSANHGFVIDIIQGSDGVDIASAESSVSSRPELTITYSTDPNSTVNLPPVADLVVSPDNPVVGVNADFDARASSDLDGSIVTYTWDFGDGQSASGPLVGHTYSAVGQYTVRLTVTDDDGLSAVAQQLLVVLGEQVELVVFQDGVSPQAGYAGTRDTKLKVDDPNRRFGGDPDLEVDGSPDYGALLAWDISSVPTGATVLSASMRLSVFDPSNDTYEVYAMNRPWSESEATWREASDGIDWQSEGAAGRADADDRVLGLLRNPGTGNTAIPLNENGLAVVQGWVDNPASNFGFLIQDYDRGNDGIDFHSREASDESDRPRLEIEYTLAGAPANRVNVTNDSGVAVTIQAASEVADRPLLSTLMSSVAGMVSSPSVVDDGATQAAREYRISTESNRSLVLAVAPADSGRVDGTFAREARMSVGSANWDLYRRTLQRGGSGVGVPEGGILFVAGATQPATTTHAAPEVATNGSGLEAYPNPFGTILRINHPQLGSGQVELADVLGRRVALIELVDGKASFDARHLSVGTYFLHPVGSRGSENGLGMRSLVVTKGN